MGVAWEYSTQPLLKLKSLGFHNQTSQNRFPLPSDIGELENVRKGSTSDPPEASHASDVAGVSLHSASTPRIGASKGLFLDLREPDIGRLFDLQIQ